MTVYQKYLKNESGTLVAEWVDAELETIEKAFMLIDPEQEFNRNLYLGIYEEMKQAKKIIDYEPDTDEFIPK